MPAPLGDHLATDASLHLLADHLTEALAEGDIEPCLLHIATPDAVGFDLGVQPLDGRHPTDVLLGQTAPDDWHAVGIATHGWAYHVAERGDPTRRRHRVHVVTLLSRSGEHAHRTRADDDALDDVLHDEAPSGEQVDLLRRVLGLPTDPPPCDPSTYWSIEWLSALVGADHAVSTLADAVALHPVHHLLRRGTALDAADTLDVLVAFHRVLTWGRMHELAGLDCFSVPDLTPDDAAWLDDGSFARFVLNRCPPLHLLKTRLGSHVPDSVADSVLDLLDDLGVPDETWPDLVPDPGQPHEEPICAGATPSTTAHLVRPYRRAMVWFRRRSTPEIPEPTDVSAPAAAAEPAPAEPGGDLVPMVSGRSLERTERALKMLATQSAQLHGQVVQLERRVDSLSDALLDRLDVPSNDDLLAARSHSARVAAELSRLEVNLAARLDAVRDELRAVQGLGGSIDLRELTPNDTGWTPARS